jgi:hypothetical protein
MISALDAARREALFCSYLSSSARPSALEVSGAIAEALERWGGVQGCRAQVAAEYGSHPEVAVMRMRWVVETIDGGDRSRTARTGLRHVLLVAPPPAANAAVAVS